MGNWLLGKWKGAGALGAKAQGCESKKNVGIAATKFPHMVIFVGSEPKAVLFRVKWSRSYKRCRVSFTHRSPRSTDKTKNLLLKPPTVDLYRPFYL